MRFKIFNRFEAIVAIVGNPVRKRVSLLLFVCPLIPLAGPDCDSKLLWTWGFTQFTSLMSFVSFNCCISVDDGKCTPGAKIPH